MNLRMQKNISRMRIWKGQFQIRGSDITRPYDDDHENISALSSP